MGRVEDACPCLLCYPRRMAWCGFFLVCCVCCSILYVLAVTSKWSLSSHLLIGTYLNKGKAVHSDGSPLLSADDLVALDGMVRSQIEWDSSLGHSYRRIKSRGKKVTPANATKSQKAPSCQKLIKGDAASVEIARRFQEGHERSLPSENVFLNLTQNCETFRKTLGYITLSMEEEKAFPVAFSILFYKDMHQVERLLRAIYRPSNFYCLHVDSDAGALMRQVMTSIASCLPGVFLASRLHDVKWAAYSVVEAELTCMRDLLKRGKWRYFINLTGQEFPLKTNLELVRILRALRGANNVDAAMTQKSFQHLWAKAGPAPFGMIPYKGNTHSILSRGFVTYLLKDEMKPYLDWLKKVIVPDETIFSTLNHNPHLRVPGSFLGFPETDVLGKPYIARFKLWRAWPNKTFRWPCRGKRVRDVCVFGVGDLPLLTSRSEVFANKFHWNYQPLALDCLELWLLQRMRSQYRGEEAVDVQYYATLDYLRHVYRPSEQETHG